jgi:drug/metabolite transporter (DMT)-like permease
MVVTSDAIPVQRTKTQEPVLVTAAALTTVVLWASAFVGIRVAGADLDPGALTLGRLLVAGVVLGTLVAIRRDAFPPRADLPRLALYGVLWFGVYNIALNWSEQHVDAGTAAIVVSTAPILIAVVAGFALGEGFPKPLLTGCAIAFTGAVLIGIGTATQTLRAGLGTALCAVAAIAYALAVVTQKPLLGHASALMVTWLACLVGIVFCLPFAAQLVHQIGSAAPSSLLWTVYLGAFPTAVAFTTWGYALARSTAGRMGATSYLVAPISVVLAWLVLAETPPWLALLGGALCLGGVVVSRHRT